VFWLHLPAGVLAGAVILLMSVTGVLLAFEGQLTRWADGPVRLSPPPPGGAPRLPVEVLLAAARGEAGAQHPSAITLRRDPAAAAEVSLGREAALFVDPYTAEVRRGSDAARVFFRAVTDWHRWLGLQGERRAPARAVTGAANLVFLLIVVSGVYLWWPRRWSRPALSTVALLQPGLRGRARDFNWHNVLGLWSSVPLFFVVLTGVLISYPWATDLLYRAAGSEPPPRGDQGRTARRGMSSGRERAAAPVPLDGLGRLWARAEKQVPEWQTITLRLPGGTEEPLVFSIDTGAGAARPDKRSQLTLDRSTGEIVRFDSYSGQSRGRQLRTWARWVHTGEAAGVAGQTVAALASMGAVVLVWTGIALSLRRFRGLLARLVSPAGEPAPRPAVVALRVSNGDGAKP
jgi:uncharacterized iron-regulated membrane protein